MINFRQSDSSRSRRFSRQQCDASVWDCPFHVSSSIGESRRWYLKQLNLQEEKHGLFNDPHMLPNVSSIDPNGVLGGGNALELRWLRPHEIVSDPEFESDGISRFDVKQGELGNCWFLAAISSLSLYKDLFELVIPPGQTFNACPTSSKQLPYRGMFWFRFWRFGQWIDVVVDDKLPTRKKQLVFNRSSDRKEFWSALLEKAYAKVIGSYESMRGGNTTEAMEDFTGGLTELVDLGSKAPKNLFRIMKRAHDRCSLMACSIDATTMDQVEQDGPMGLILGHAYSITDVRAVLTTNGSGAVQLIRLQNPWGNDREWRGAWSDQSSEWKSIPPSERENIGLVFDNDGEFWMAFEDFVRYFSRLEFCHIGPDGGGFGRSFSVPHHNKRQWEIVQEEGEWISHATAGGCRNYSDTFHANPQFRIEVTDPDESDDEPWGTVIIGLMQKGRRERQQIPHTIGYAIYRIDQSYHRDRLLGKSFFARHKAVDRSPRFINLREVCGRHNLEPGSYVIVPSTFAPNEEAKFLLRVFSERACESKELDDMIALNPVQAMAVNTEDSERLQKLKASFTVLAGPAGVITANELLDILNAAFKRDFPNETFGLETARSMVALKDIDRSGALSFDEFVTLWEDLRLWLSIFLEFDKDKSKTLDGFELRFILSAIGLKVSNQLYHSIINRYVRKDGHVTFEDYLLLLVRLLTLFETFRTQSFLDDGEASFNLEEFMRSAIYL